MRVLLILTVVVAALLVGVVGFDGAATPPPADGAPGRERPSSAESGAPAAPREPLSDPTREPVPAAALVWRARCVDQADGRPVAGCELVVGGRSVRSRSDGGFELPVSAEFATVEVEVRSSGHVPVTVALAIDAAAQWPSLVRLRAAARVRGLLVDEHGTPCAGSRVAFTPLVAREPVAGQRERTPSWVRTGDDGTFAFATPLPAGPARIAAPDVPPLLDDARVALRPGAEHFLTLRCRSWSASDEIEGVVVDGDGAAVSNAFVELLAGADDGATVWRTTVARDDGGFRLVRPAGASSSVWLRAAQAPGRFATAAIGPITWGERHVTLRLPRPVGLSVRVVDERSGTAIEHYAIRCVPTRGVRSSRAGQLQCDDVHADGRCVVEGLAPGPYDLQVVPRDRRWSPGLPVAVEVATDGTAAVEVELARARILTVSTRTAAGEPVAGLRVQAVLPGEGSAERDLDQLLVHGGLRSLPNVRMAEAVTGADGIARLRLPAGLGPFELRLDGADRPAWSVADVGADETHLDLVPPGRGFLRLQLAGAGGAQVALRAGSDRSPIAWRSPPVLDADGALTLPVPVGSWQVLVLVPASAGGAVRALPPLATVDIAADQTTTLARPLPIRTDGAVSGAAFVDGSAAAEVVLLLGEERDDGTIRVVHRLHESPDEHGRFRFAGLGAGPFALQIRSTSAGRTLVLPQGDWRTLAVGERLDVGSLAVTTARVEVTVVDGGGPASGLLIVRAADGAVLATRLDADGRAQFERVPVGGCRVELRVGRVVHPLGSRSVEAGVPTRLRLTVR